MKKSNYIWLVLLVVGTVLILLRHNNIISWGDSAATYRNEKGLIFGTMYSITYEHDESLKLDIDNELKRFDASLSMFNESSIIRSAESTVMKNLLLTASSQRCLKWQ